MIRPFDYHKLQTRLLKKAGRKTSPIKAMFEITYRCNLRCRHCYVVFPSEARISTDNQCPSVKISANQCDKESIAISEKKELNTEEVFIILEQLAAAGCLNLGFTGGEPFLRKDIFDILAYAKRLGFNTIVLTNGTLITPKKADRLKEIGLNKLDVSFHTTNKEVFDWFTQAPGTYAKVLKAVGLLRERKIEVYLKTTAMTINKDEFVKIRHLAVERFGTHFRWTPAITPAWDGKKENLRFRLTPDEINYLQKEIDNDTEIEFEKLDPLEKKNRRPKKKRKRQEGKINHNRLFRCGAGRTEVVIDPYGQMRLCMDIPRPKYQILKGSFAEGWRMLSDYVKNTPPGPSYQCRDCELVQYCGFCPARGWLECGDMSACPPYCREKAYLVRMEVEKELLNR